MWTIKKKLLYILMFVEMTTMFLVPMWAFVIFGTKGMLYSLIYSGIAYLHLRHTDKKWTW